MAYTGPHICVPFTSFKQRYEHVSIRVGCTDLLIVYTANYESTGLIQAMKIHMETVHSTSVTLPARTEKAEDIDKSCIPKIDKGLHRMSKEE